METKMENLLITHVRNTNNDPIATIVTNKDGMLGLSICSEKEKRFNRKRGREIAIGRMAVGSEVVFPNRKKSEKKAILNAIENLEERGKKYYKNPSFELEKSWLLFV